jgi:2,3-bisphosphoglycerate-independent phosphoglycerate mutase
MDRDKRWERVKVAYDCIVKGEGKASEDMLKAVEESYAEGVTDEFIKPIVHVRNGKPVATIEEGDVVIFFNYRNDRAKELTIVLTQQDMPENGMTTISNLQYYCMTPYDSSFQGLHILFPKENVQNTMGEIVSNAGLKQLRIAETEKFAHVTFFFNGGREAPLPGEDRRLVPSPKVGTYDLQPEMSAAGVSDALVEAIAGDAYDLIVANFANPDMVGHTGVWAATIEALTVLDGCLARIVAAIETVEARDPAGPGALLAITADHGNADELRDADGHAVTAHSLNRVPFVLVGRAARGLTLADGVLADVAPTLLEFAGLPPWDGMTGRSRIL